MTERPTLPARVLVLRDEGRQAEAEQDLKAWLAERPDEPEGLALLSHLQLGQGKVAEAEATWTQLAASAPGSGPACRAGARLLLRKRQVGEALAAARAALAAEPEQDENGLVLAAALVAAGAAAEALAIVDGLIAAARPTAQAHVVRAQALARLGRPAEAAAALESALELRPRMPLWATLGSIRLETGDPAGAAEAFEKSLALQPDDAAVLASLAQLERVAQRYEPARTLYERAVALQPDLMPARLGLADVLLDLNDLDGARAVFEQVLAEHPSLPMHLRARLLLPAIVGSEAEIQALRAAYEASLEAAADMDGQIAERDRSMIPGWFYLAYHGLDDRPILEALDRLLTAKAPAFSVTSPHLAAWTPPAETGRRIKVGFVSQFFHNHTNGRLYAELIAQLDRNRFEVVVAHLPGAKDDALRGAIDSAADRAIQLPRELAGQRDRLAEEQLDVLFFTDIGMGSTSYWLARARLAPVQATSWGYPSTTGLRSIDYFVSSDLIEPEGAEDAYSERLIRLPRLPCFYSGLPMGRRLDRAALGLPEAGVLYGCLQSLFKLHPDFDAVLAQIAAADPDARLVFIDTHPVWSAALRKRWAKFPVLGERLLFLPRMPVADFLSLTSVMDVLLDPPHFGSGNTLYEAAGLGTPIVTWPGRFARGRIVAGAYAQMGIADAPVAATLEDYAGLAVSVAHDRARRQALGEQLVAGAERDLYRDEPARRAIEAFLEAAVEAAGRGEVLPDGWKPAP